MDKNVVFGILERLDTKEHIFCLRISVEDVYTRLSRGLPIIEPAGDLDLAFPAQIMTLRVAGED